MAYHDALLGGARPAAAACALRPALPPAEPFVPSHYAGSRHRPLILLVVALHALALFALIALDGAPVTKRLGGRLAVTMIALDPPPPPRAPSKAAPPPSPKVEAVAPPPIVPVVIASPPPTIAAVPPPPTPVAAPSPPAPPASPPGPPSPVVAADLMADVVAGDPPRYPTESRRLRESGTVRLRLAISPAGSVDEIAVAQSSGFDRLDKAAVAAVRKWRFRPSVRGGAAVGATGYLPITFTLPR